MLQAMEQLTQTTLRNIFGGLSLDTSLTSRDETNRRLRLVLDEVTEKWGVRVNRLELKDIMPPQDIQLAMEKQMQAERNKRAAVLTAEGAQQAAILRAEGQRQALIVQSEAARQAAILRAQGKAQALVTMQEAQARALSTVFRAVNTSAPTQQVMQYLYLQMLPKLADNPANKVIVVPAEMGGLARLASALFIRGQLRAAGARLPAGPPEGAHGAGSSATPANPGAQLPAATPSGAPA
jgi:regulator of protease activity HflC (stomatin/prohibitin superfamily)